LLESSCALRTSFNISAISPEEYSDEEDEADEEEEEEEEDEEEEDGSEPSLPSADVSAASPLAISLK